MTACVNCSGIVLSIRPSSVHIHSKAIRLARETDTIDLDLPFCDPNEGLWGFLEVGDRVEQQGDSLVLMVTRPTEGRPHRFELPCCDF